jgi:hypothetical protein
MLIQLEQIALFFFDIIMALGRVTNIKWVQEGRIFEGNYCTAQGKPPSIWYSALLLTISFA